METIVLEEIEENGQLYEEVDMDAYYFFENEIYTSPEYDDEFNLDEVLSEIAY